eukprot:10462162-Karenia_brevis.AAC.1
MIRTTGMPIPTSPQWITALMHTVLDFMAILDGMSTPYYPRPTLEKEKRNHTTKSQYHMILN